MNIVRLLVCLLITFVFVKLLIDGISIMKNNTGNIVEGMGNLNASPPTESPDVALRLEKENQQYAKKEYEEEQESLAKAGLLSHKHTSNSKHGHEKRNPNGDDCQKRGLTYCMANSNCDNDSYCAKKCVEGTCDGKTMHPDHKPGHNPSHKHGHKHGHNPNHKHGHKLGPGGTQHLLGPGGTQHKHHHSHGRRVPDDSHSHKYKKFIPDKLDQLPLTKSVYEEIGRDFVKDEAKKRGVKSPGIHDSEAEVLGKMVWRVYAAEVEQKRKSSPKANDQLLEREIQLLNKVSKIMKSDTDHHKGKGKKHKGITNQASSISKCGPRHYTDSRTNNLYGYTPPSSNDVHREPGHAFQGTPIPGAPIYHDISNAIEHCETDRACGGVNYDSTTGKFFLMPVHSKIVRRPHYTAFIKKKHRRHTNPHHNHDKESGRSHGHHHGQPSPYLPETGIGFSSSPCQCKNGHPRNPNKLPRPYNSLMDLFH